MAASIQLSAKTSKLKACEEVVFVGMSGVEDQNFNVCAWDLRTGNLLQSFRNGTAAPYSLTLLGGEALMAASHTKPVIHVWNLHSQSQRHRKLICGKHTSCLTSTPDSNYIAAGLEDKIHIWQVCTGHLYSILSHSSVEVKCLKFSHIGEFLVSGYKDGTVAVWELQECLQHDHPRIMDHGPVGTFTGHSGEITGLHITLSNRVVSCAMDFTVKIWDLQSMEELHMFELGAPVWSVVVDHSELALYAGDHNGKVHCIDLNYQPTEKTVHLGTTEEDIAFISYTAHLGPVIHMCLSVDQSRLVTASNDKMIKVWPLMSPVSPMVITVNDQISNLLVVPTPHALVSPEHLTSITINNLSRQLYTGHDDDDVDVTIEIHDESNSKAETSEGDSTHLLDFESLKHKANKLKRVNTEIYQFALREIIK